MRQLFLAVLLCSLLLTGCAPHTDLLLAPPRTAEQAELLTLQAPVLFTGQASYLAPSDGNSAEGAYALDFDGDGVNELVSCLLLHQKPCVEIYRQTEKKPVLAARITGEGSGIASLSFPKLDAAGTVGLVITWELEGSALHGLTVCAYFEGRFDTLYSGAVIDLAIADLDGDGGEEILFLEQSETQDYQAVMLDYQSGGLRASAAVPLSRGLRNILQCAAANIGFDRVALIVEGYLEPYGYLTDVIVAADGKLQNLYLSAGSGVSEITAREYPIFCSDVNNDGIVELPRPITLTEIVESGETSAEALLFDWCRCNPDAEPEVLYTTYHQLEEGWFFRMPDRMRHHVLPVPGVQTDGVSTTRFYFLSGEGQRGKLLWEVYVLSAEDAEFTEEICALRRLAAADGCLYSLRYHGSVNSSYYTKTSLPTLFSLMDAEKTVGSLISYQWSTQDGGTK